jgi:hypothetical protein
MVPDGSAAPRETGRLTVGRNSNFNFNFTIMTVIHNKK